MSKISLVSNSSGSGTFSIASPNTNSDRTLTLPDSTGTLATAESTLAQFSASGSAPVYACRAWVNFNGSGTVAIRSSGNVSSITDLAAGEYQVNFATAMPDANYATSVTSSTNSAYNSDGFSLAAVLSNLTTPHVTTAYVQVGTALAANGNGSDLGAVCMNVSVFR